MKTGKLACAMAVLMVAITTACSPAKAMLGFSNKHIRYKITVTVDTPEGEKSASAVREASAYTEPSVLPDQGGTSYTLTKGEAVVLDLGPRGVLFVLLGQDDEARLVFRFFQNATDPTPVTLERMKYPMFVRFRDLNDPKTVQNVLENEPCLDSRGQPTSKQCPGKDHFVEYFGEGVALKSVTIEMTDELVTAGNIAKYIPWLEERAKLPGYIGADPADRIDLTKTWLTPASFRTKGI